VSGNTNLVIKFCSKEDLFNLAAYKGVGFIIGLSLRSTFVALREAIDQNNLEGLPPDGNWKFYIQLVMSSGQESILHGLLVPNLENGNPVVIYVCLPLTIFPVCRQDCILHRLGHDQCSQLEQPYVTLGRYYRINACMIR
jgi:hypothetical protein